MGKTATAVSAYDGFAMAVPIFNPDGTCGLDLKPIVAWQIEGAHTDTGQLVPVTEYEDDRIEPDAVYAIQRPDGSFRFPDGERCDSEDDLLASFRKRCRESEEDRR